MRYFIDAKRRMYSSPNQTIATSHNDDLLLIG